MTRYKRRGFRGGGRQREEDTPVRDTARRRQDHGKLLAQLRAEVAEKVWQEQKREWQSLKAVKREMSPGLAPKEKPRDIRGGHSRERKG